MLQQDWHIELTLSVPLHIINETIINFVANFRVTTFHFFISCTCNVIIMHEQLVSLYIYL